MIIIKTRRMIDALENVIILYKNTANNYIKLYNLMYGLNDKWSCKRMGFKDRSTVDRNRTASVPPYREEINYV